MTRSLIPKTGDTVWSEYFGCLLIVTRYFHDDVWYFYRANDPKKEELRARTAWSKMP